MSPPGTGVTLNDAVRAATQMLRDAGIADAAGDARRLVAEACGGDGLVLVREPERVLRAAEAEGLSRMIGRRAAREPVARILGWREFFGRRFAISGDVLDPRADTETVVETALEICDREGWRRSPIRILDLGTGSGCLLLSLLAELPNATGKGLDISEGAVDVARTNGHSLGLTARCSFDLCDMRSAELAGFDLVVSNPPYIRSGDIAGLDPDVARFDPKGALDGGPDGLQFYRDILARARGGRNRAQGPQWLALEAGVGQVQQIIDIARELGLCCQDDAAILRHDLNGVARCVALKTLP